MKKLNIKIIRLGLLAYREAHKQQMQFLEDIHEGRALDDICLILEHPAVFTLGRNGHPENVTVSGEFLRTKGVELIQTERGGEVTYHGPGQIVCYPLINLRRRNLGVAEYVNLLEKIMLQVAAHFGIKANRDPRNHGIWRGDQKIGSIGISVRHGITYHGMALNVNLDLEPFSWVNPCGLMDVTMGSMAEVLQQPLNMKDVETVMTDTISREFNPVLADTVPSTKKRMPKPEWLKRRLPSGPGYEKTRRQLATSKLHTVCQEARCPNQFECFGKGTATFMLMGDNCTRNCGFCAIGHGGVEPLDSLEPTQIAAAIKNMGLTYAVLTSVTRDDLPDGGADHFGKTLVAIRASSPQAKVEILIPDLMGNAQSLQSICKYNPSVLNHNIETVARLYPNVRPQASYSRSLTLLKRVKEEYPHIVTKSGLMLGLGETQSELETTMADIRETGCDLLTLGQYLQPTKDNVEVFRYVPPAEFDAIRDVALRIGFKGVAAGPHVRSSYRASDLYKLVI